jgi:hypothetical protein
MVSHGELDELVLTPGSFLPDSRIKKELLHRYYPRPEAIKTELKRSTIIWHAPGRYTPTPPLTREIAGVYLKGVLSKEVQAKAWYGLEAMKWATPKRPETRTAVDRQKGLTAPGELTMGYNGYMTIERTKVVRQQATQFRMLAPLMEEMNACFARVLPAYYRLQNVPKTLMDRWAERETEDPKKEYGGIGQEFRQFLTSFSTIALLKSCPSSIHKDGGNARPDQASFTCLTSIGEEFSGGTFCLIEYGLKIPVKPGDLFIGQTNREWHYNTTPVKGTKYSLVCYYRRSLGNPKLKRGKSTYDNPPKEEH